MRAETGLSWSPARSTRPSSSTGTEREETIEHGKHPDKNRNKRRTNKTFVYSYDHPDITEYSYSYPLQTNILLDGDAMLMECSLSTVLRFLTSVRVCQTRTLNTVRLKNGRQENTHCARSL